MGTLRDKLLRAGFTREETLSQGVNAATLIHEAARAAPERRQAAQPKMHKKPEILIANE